MKPENIINEAPKIAKDIGRISKVRSKKKADVLSLRYKKLRGRVFRISMLTATIPIILMLLIMTYSIALFGEFGLITPSNCSLPPPIDIEINVGDGTRCYTYIIWVIFFVYLMVMPLYNRISGVDLLRSFSEKR